jgi:Ca2+-binding EF-hand superfamily protein
MLLAIADRNADGLLTRAEMDRYLNLQAAAARHCVVVSASDLGSPLFAVLDADGDETLSLRELRHGWSRVAAWDASGDQALSWDEIPQACQLTWSLGRPMAPPPSTTPPTTKLAAPPWFSGMDQNGDGDLSRREFLGSLEEFQRWDTDADGLISPEESRRMTKH